MQILHSWVLPASSALAGGAAPGRGKLWERVLGSAAAGSLGAAVAPDLVGGRWERPAGNAQLLVEPRRAQPKKPNQGSPREVAHKAASVNSNLHVHAIAK
eukprot:4035889-Pyramimonas_sp.AAC.1